MKQSGKSLFTEAMNIAVGSDFLAEGLHGQEGWNIPEEMNNFRHMQRPNLPFVVFPSLQGVQCRL